MNIKIWDDKYLIKSDSRCYKLLEVKESEKDNETDETENVIGYYSTINHLFKGLAEREGRLNKCTTMEGYIRHLEKVNKKLEENLQVIATIVGVEESMERVMNCIADKLPDSIKNLGEKEG